MSNLENDKIQEACYEDFRDLFDVSESFKDLILECFHPFEAWYEKEYGRYDDRVLVELFKKLWDFDCELLCGDKRTCIEAYIMYNQSIKKLNGLLENEK